MKADKNTIGRVLVYIKTYRHLLFVSVFLALVTSLLSLYIPILAGRAIDCIVGAGNVDIETCVSILIRIAVITLVSAVAQWVMNYINNKITYNVVRDVRNDAFEKIHSLPLSYIDSHPSGDLVSRIISDADTFADGLLLGFTQFFTGVVTIFGTLFFMVSIRPFIALLVVILTPASLFTARFIAKHTHDMFKKQSEIRGRQTSFINEMIGNIKLIQSCSQESFVSDRFDEINSELEDASLKAIFYSSLTNPSTRFINNLIYAVVALVGAYTSIKTGGLFTIGQLTCFLSYANQYTKPFNEISGVITELQNSIVCAGRILDLIDEESETPDVAENADINISGDISFRDVCFSYDSTKKLIENFTLDVKSGQRVAIVGPTGCGKTTLINLIMRFYDTNSGDIVFDETEIRNMPRHRLRESIGMVLQETWLKSGTIRENIIMGKPDATDEEITEAAKAAHSYGFIRRLPDGFDTVIGEDGGSLSQGQKQLLCITRLMLCRMPMLILDEATSSIDTRTEVRIQSAFSKLMNGRTSFIVAHRLSTIRNADVILVMKDGNIIEKGSHTELLKAKGFYSQLYKASKGYANA